jgi:hypothetical protein
MSMIWRRYVKSTGYARPWFYVALALGFAVLAAWAIIERDWIVGAIAVVMVVLATIAAPISRRMARGLAASEAANRGQV